MRKLSLEPNDLHFGQQHIKTAKLFGDRYHTVPLKKMPHYTFLLGHEKTYEKYLTSSWSYYKHKKENTIQERVAQTVKFKKLQDNISKRGCLKPIVVCKRFDGKYIIVEGNHRAAICLFLNVKIGAIEVPLKTQLDKIINIPNEFYGTKNKGRAYQSIYHNHREIIVGRRRDILNRMKLIDIEDIQHKEILDIGCNIGGSSLLAAQMGAKKVLGVEISEDILTAAIRLNVLFGLPCYFEKRDFSKENHIQKFDTTFVFSVDRHINNNKMLAKNILINTRKIVYFETHQNSDIPPTIKKIFSKVEFKGYTGHGKRKFYKCQI